MRRWRSEAEPAAQPENLLSAYATLGIRRVICYPFYKSLAFLNHTGNRWVSYLFIIAVVSNISSVKFLSSIMYHSLTEILTILNTDTTHL